METFAPVTIDQRASSRVAGGHPWVFANEIKGDLKAFQPGQAVSVQDGRGRAFGFGYINPRSLIAVRLLSTKEIAFDADFFAEKLESADAFRKRFRPGVKSYRVCFGESDGVPGLVVDRFDDVFVVQSHAAGIDTRTDAVVAGLKKAFSPKGVLLKYDSSSRTLEGLANRIEVVHGDVPEALEVDMEGSRFVLNLRAGQKTGFFHDQAANRERFSSLVRGASVLDVFSYVGAWSLAAMKGGATSAFGIDSSADAVGWATRNAEKSGVAAKVRFEKADAFDKLAALEQAKERFDAVVLDPPAFVKSRKQLDAGMRGYREINRRGFALVKPGGLLVTSSCSRHVGREGFVGMLQGAADDAHRRARIVAFGQQGADHPIHLELPETGYLTCVFLEVR